MEPQLKLVSIHSELINILVDFITFVCCFCYKERNCCFNVLFRQILTLIFKFSTKECSVEIIGKLCNSSGHSECQYSQNKVFCVFTTIKELGIIEQYIWYTFKKYNFQYSLL